jgi:hypothetical protein
MFNNVRHAPERDSQLPPPSLPAPRVRVRQTEDGHAVEPTPYGESDQEGVRAQFLAAFGTTEFTVAEALYQQLLDVLCLGRVLDTATADLILAFLHRIGPKDEIEAMLACQMVVAHLAVMSTARRALHVSDTGRPRTTPSASTANRPLRGHRMA